jgi:hypothetical protein
VRLERISVDSRISESLNGKAFAALLPPTAHPLVAEIRIG